MDFVLPAKYLNKKWLLAKSKRMPKMCFVYAWFRPSKGYLYVGSTRKGLHRFVAHHVIGVACQIEPNDEIHIWFSKENEMLDLEIKLTKSLLPYYNTREGCHERGVWWMNNGIRGGKELKRLLEEFQ